MKWFILILSCCSALAQHPLLTGAGIDWTRASSANITNFPITTLGAEHYWLASDLPQATIFPATGWRDRIVDVDTNAWITNNVIKGWPTNRSDGLQFIGNESLVLSNSVLGKSNISITNPSIRAVFMVVSSTKATASYFLGAAVATGNDAGIWWNNSGGSGTTAGNRVYHDQGGAAHDLGGQNSFKNDGTIQDVGVIGTTPATPIISCYTNGSVALTGVNGSTAANFSNLGENAAFAFNGKILAIITAINPSPVATWFSNAHYWSTNMFSLPPP